MSLVIKRAADETVIPSIPGTYRRVVELWGRYHLSTPTTKFWAEICCVDCGKPSLIGRNHDVDDAGNVTASYVCPFCPWHVHIKLDDWNRPGPRRI